MRTPPAKAQASKAAKSRAAKKRRLDAEEKPSQARWWIAAGAILLAACILRLIFPDLKPLHHDEGVNGLFMTQLFRTGYYHYDPANYHGPSLYYFGLVTTTLNALFHGKEGLSTFAIRLVPALFGIGIIWLVLSLRRYLGDFSVLSAAALLTVSPGMVYYSRYFIHEIPFVFFTLAIVMAALRYGETRQPRYLLLASASAALLFCTKETCIISFAVLLLAWICTRVYLSLRKRPAGQQRAALSSTDEKREWRYRQYLYLAAALVFISISVLFYSSFFTNPHGVADSVRTFDIWVHRGEQSTYTAPWSRYLEWLSREELPILVLGGLGILIALWQARQRFAVFVAFWVLGISTAYSLVPYKTPWLALNLILPLGIMAGYALGRWYGSTLVRQSSAVLVLLVALGASLRQAIDLSFFRYDDDSIPYVYAHTSRQLLDLVREVEQIANRNPAGKQIGIEIVSPEYWPLPWYFRDYPRALFWGRMVPLSEPVLIASPQQASAIESNLGQQYRRYKTYDLRPGNVLVLYLRKDIQP
jgi:uncharacterized protein (TIGR03663 family)